MENKAVFSLCKVLQNLSDFKLELEINENNFSKKPEITKFLSP